MPQIGAQPLRSSCLTTESTNCSSHILTQRPGEQSRPVQCAPSRRSSATCTMFACKWIRLTAPHFKISAQLNRAHCTQRQARAALAESATSCAEMLEEAFGQYTCVKRFRSDAWARAWPVGPEMLCYMVSHEAHHRGQVCMLAHQLGFRLPNKVTSEMWNWETLSKQTGFALGSGYSS